MAGFPRKANSLGVRPMVLLGCRINCNVHNSACLALKRRSQQRIIAIGHGSHAAAIKLSEFAD